MSKEDTSFKITGSPSTLISEGISSRTMSNVLNVSDAEEE
jgi:hypothetical protein